MNEQRTEMNEQQTMQQWREERRGGWEQREQQREEMRREWERHGWTTMQQQREHRGQ